MEAEARRLIDAGQMPSLEQVLTVVAEGQQQQWGSQNKDERRSYRSRRCFRGSLKAMRLSGS